jgi:hypothetical protein
MDEELKVFQGGHTNDKNRMGWKEMWKGDASLRWIQTNVNRWKIRNDVWELKNHEWECKNHEWECKNHEWEGRNE